ncbi:branched-chain amino acid ABC transporter permease [Paracraurococcus ruber]|uniref:Branched-chain amino acid ABC transporter permease n=2 Tax=Paracraurococcus ruber TaxID=77675 RepID=A0ABS1CSL4_9PROT|nr:branched-chain amino acid ABC transporter permease [Paracraurococcus ruber]TDG34332.1 branched-chain amino acid ABC transporter permease [Paracraurococcus ruber]
MVLVVLGLGIVASMMGVFNFAHGEFVLLGAFTVWVAERNGFPSWAGMLAAPFIVAAIGWLLERTVVHRFYASPVVGMLGTYAIGLVLREVVRGLTGGQFHTVGEPVGGSFDLLGLTVPAWRSVVILVTLAVVLGAWLLLARTTLGLQVRAALENPALARASGISTTRLYAATFAFGAGLAGLAGALVVPLFSLFADLGLRFLVQGFLSVMLGGVGSFEGPVLGSAAIGMLSAGLPWVVPPILADVLVFVLALVVIKLRPQGFIHRKGA